MYIIHALNFGVKTTAKKKKNEYVYRIQNVCVDRALPKRGTASEVAGIVSATMFRKTVNDRRIVTPLIKKMFYLHAYRVRIIIIKS